MKRILACGFLVLGLVVLAVGPAYAPPFRLPVFRPPPVRPPITIPKISTYPPAFKSLPPLNPAVRPGFSGTLPPLGKAGWPGSTAPWPGLDPVLPKITPASRIEVLAYTNPLKAASDLKSNWDVLPALDRQRLGNQVSGSLLKQLHGVEIFGGQKWETAKAIKDLLKTEGLDGVTKVKLKDGLEGFYESQARKNLSDALGELNKGRWDEAGKAAGRDLFRLPSDLEGVRLANKIKKLAEYEGALAVAQGGKAVSNPVLPRDLAVALEGRTALNHLNSCLYGKKAGLKAKDLQKWIEEVVTATGDEALGRRLGRELSFQLFLDGHPTQARALLRSCPRDPADAAYFEGMFRDMQVLLTGSGEVTTPAGRVFVENLGAGAGTVRGPPVAELLIPEAAGGFRVRIADNILTDLPPLGTQMKVVEAALTGKIQARIVAERVHLSHAKNYVHQTVRVYIKEPSPGIPSGPDFDDPEKEKEAPQLTEEEAIREVEAFLGRPLNDAEREQVRIMHRARTPIMLIRLAFVPGPAPRPIDPILFPLGLGEPR